MIVMDFNGYKLSSHFYYVKQVILFPSHRWKKLTLKLSLSSQNYQIAKRVQKSSSSPCQMNLLFGPSSCTPKNAGHVWETINGCFSMSFSLSLSLPPLSKINNIYIYFKVFFQHFLEDQKI